MNSRTPRPSPKNVRRVQAITALGLLHGQLNRSRLSTRLRGHALFSRTCLELSAHFVNGNRGERHARASNKTRDTLCSRNRVRRLQRQVESYCSMRSIALIDGDLSHDRAVGAVPIVVGRHRRLVVRDFDSISQRICPKTIDITISFRSTAQGGAGLILELVRTIFTNV